MATKTIKEGHVTTEILDETGGTVDGALDAEALMAKMGGKAGTYEETLPDGTVVTYELDVEEFEVKSRNLLKQVNQT